MARTKKKPIRLDDPPVAGRCSSGEVLCVCLPVEGSSKCAVHDRVAAARAADNFERVMGSRVSPASYASAVSRGPLMSTVKEKFWPTPWEKSRKNYGNARTIAKAIERGW